MRGEGPPVRSEEVEYTTRLAIEVVVLWGADALCASHFAVPSAVFVGGASDCDVALPAELLGTERRCVAVSSHGDVCAVLPGGVRGWLTLPDGSTRPFDEGTPVPFGEHSERLLPLALGYRAHLCFSSVEIQVATVRLGRPCRRALGLDASLLASLGMSALMVAGLMAVLSRLTPVLGLNHDEQAERARLLLVRTYLAAAAERAEESQSEGGREPSRAAATKRPPQSAVPREATSNEADIDAQPVESALGLQGTATPARDPIERRQQVEGARKFGIIGMLDWPELSDPRLRFERNLDGEELALMQQLFNPDGASVPEGPGGLSLSGVGIGGGGKADVIGLAAVRTAAEGQGRELDRFPGATSETGAHTPRAVALRQRESIVSDPLAAASIRRAVLAERTTLRKCHEGSGEAVGVMVRFVVLGNGQIDHVNATDPALPANVSRCIERVFLGLSVPNPVSRPVHVAYRVALDS